ncbi:cobalt-precorrin-6A reductase [Granulicella sp. S190]|uniref:cobalt-precorrin-6A reductase n=1 Tax=Granulicella sp. S190 TaxID=1747226 RepID=UPI00131B32C2|nr:cobalt-precorrin-6A reductase [Granulicella sp. S190]
MKGAFDRVLKAPPRILILGGTAEASQLAERLERRKDLSLISSLAGRLSKPQLPVGPVRVGGFGGVDGLVSYLRSENIRAVVDVTHPFAVTISCNAEDACARLGLPLVKFVRPPWEKTKNDCWHEVADIKRAAEFFKLREARVLLSVGRQEVSSFAFCSCTWFLIRAIEDPQEPLPLHHQVLLKRGPFDLRGELRLLQEYSIDYIVSKNSGGSATYPKIEAARSLGIPVVMIGRPDSHSVSNSKTIDDILSRVDRLVQAESNSV